MAKRRRRRRQHDLTSRWGRLSKRQYRALVKFNKALGDGVATTEAMLMTHGFRKRRRVVHKRSRGRLKNRRK